MRNDAYLTPTAAALLAAGLPLERREEDPIDRLARAFEAHSEAVAGHLERFNGSLTDVNDRLGSMEARPIPAAARRGGVVLAGTPATVETRAVTWGDQVARSDDLRRLDSSTGRLRIEVRDLTSDPASAGGLVTPDRRPDITMLPHRRLTVRNLLNVGQTTSNSVEFMKQTGFTNNAAPTAEGALKPKSELTFSMEDAKVRTIPHFVKASRQIIADAPLLASTIDGELRYGLDVKEEDQLLSGNGTGQNLHGLIPQATPYETARDIIGDTRFDTLLHALEQAEIADLPASGIVLNTSDWFAMLGIKDGDGNYISGGPLASVPDRIWRLPVVWTNAMTKGDFLVGAFSTAASIYDRQETTVEMGYENDDFTRNLVTILAEKRLAVAVKRPEAIVKGTFPTVE